MALGFLIEHFMFAQVDRQGKPGCSLRLPQAFANVFIGMEFAVEPSVAFLQFFGRHMPGMKNRMVAIIFRPIGVDESLFPDQFVI